MHTIRLRVNDKAYNKLISLLSKFTSQEVEIIPEDISFEESKKYLTEELDDIKSGKAIFLSIDEVNSSLENVIIKYENKI